jgi:hypothetical protein
MSEGLVKLANTNVTQMDDLNSVSELIQNYVLTENTNVAEVIQKKLNDRPGLIGVFFPNRIQREHEKLTIQQMQDLFKNRQEMLSIFVNLQMELARRAGEKLILAKTQQYEAELIEQGIDISTHLTAISQTKLNEIGDVFERSKREFVERMKRQEIEAESCKESEFLYKEYRESIRYEIQAFFRIIRGNLEKFESSLNISLQGALRHFTKEV